jgi:hypothetical protein
MSPGEVLVLAAAGVGAGIVNAIAGGGSMLTFPVLVATGLPALTANCSNCIAQTPGYVTVVLGYRPELRGQGPRFRSLAPAALVGAVLGVIALRAGSAATFDAIVPVLILAACALLVVQPHVADLAARRHGTRGHGIALQVLVALGGAYGAYFGAAVGVLLLAIFASLIPDDLQRLNAMNRALVLLVTVLAASVYAVLGPVDWVAVAVLAPTTLVGGALGVRVARSVSTKVLRILVVVLGVAAAAALALT